MQPIRLLFVCHGNICRSTMAEYVMKHLVDQAGMSDRFVIDSAATSTEEIGNPVHRGTRKELARQGIPCGDHRARQLRRADANAWDYFIGMDSANIRNMKRMLGPEADGKIFKLLEFTGRGDDVADPWYTGDFRTTYRDVDEGCRALLAKLTDGK